MPRANTELGRRPGAKIRTKISLAVAAAILCPASAVACDVCYGAADSPWLDATRASVWLMLGVTAAVQVAFAAFFLNLRSRIKAEAARRARLPLVERGGAS